ncbi:MAG: cobalamin biosynthesis protein [Deltaproteobacteria bacterium]|nr:cobalamin biosynthesis protein [Deltaproteobacteria bacterium]
MTDESRNNGAGGNDAEGATGASQTRGPSVGTADTLGTADVSGTVDGARVTAAPAGPGTEGGALRECGGGPAIGPAAGSRTAVYAVTRPGLKIAGIIAAGLSADLYAPERLAPSSPPGTFFYETFLDLVASTFHRYRGHVAVAATGLMVRAIAPHLVDKKTDPAVVSLGQDGRFAVSLLSGHLGGGNDLARAVAELTGGTAVVNTATDIESKPSLEVLARDCHLAIEDFARLPPVSRVLSEGGKVPLYDPDNFLAPKLVEWRRFFPPIAESSAFDPNAPGYPVTPSLYVDYRLRPFPRETLVMRPPALALGVGCHRHLELSDLTGLIDKVLADNLLSPLSLALISTAEIRASEPALQELARRFSRPLVVQSMEALAAVQTPNPSDKVYEQIGVFSVCEAAARLAARMGPLLVPKQKNSKATCALALMNY